MYIGQYVLPTELCDQILLPIFVQSAHPISKGEFCGELEAWGLCNPYRMDYQLSHATFSF